MKLFILLIFTLSTFCIHAQDRNEFPNQLQTSKTEKLVRIEGTSVYASIPKDYQYIKELGRYQKADNLYIQFIQSNASNFDLVKPKFTKEAIEAKGAKVDEIENFKLNQFDAIYAAGPSKSPSQTKLMLVFGDQTFVAMIIGVYETSNQQGKNDLLNIFRSIYYDKSLQLDPFELANFEFDHSITNFKYATTATNIYLFTQDGKQDIQNPTANTFQIISFPKITEEKAYSFSNDLADKYEIKGFTLDNKDIIKTQINNYPAYVLKSKSSYNGRSGIIYQVLLVGENSSVIFIGSAYNNIEDIQSKFEKTVESIKIK